MRPWKAMQDHHAPAITGQAKATCHGKPDKSGEYKGGCARLERDGLPVDGDREADRDRRQDVVHVVPPNQGRDDLQRAHRRPHQHLCLQCRTPTQMSRVTLPAACADPVFAVRFP